MNRWLLPALVLVALAVGGWLLFGGGARTSSRPGARGEGDAEVTTRAPGRLREASGLDDGEGSAPLVDETDDDEARSTRTAARTNPGDLVVRVVDPSDRPVAGLTVHVGGAELEAVTNEEGRAVLRGARKLGRQRGGVPLRFEIVSPLAVERSLARDELEADEVVVQVPFTGALHVDVVNELDETPTDAVEVQLELIDERELEDPSLVFARKKWGRSGTSVTYPFVELGHTFDAVAWRKGYEVRSSTRTPGPLRAGQRIDVVVQTGVTHPVLVLRAVDASGAPLVETALSVEPSSHFSFAKRHETTTDGAGVFTVDSEAGWTGQGALIVRAECEGEPLSGVIDLDGRVVDGRNDLGDVVLSPAEALVRGVVVGPDGAGLAGAVVKAGKSASWEGERGLPGHGAQLVRGTTSTDGSFTLYGQQPDEVFRVWAQAGHLRSLPHQARAGEELTLELEPYWRVRGSLVLDGPRPRITLVGEDELNSVLLQSDQREFELPLTVEGTYDLVFLYGENEVHRLTGLTVDRDLDVGEIDLTDAVATHDLRLIGPKVTKGTVQWRACGEEVWSSSQFDLASRSPRLVSFGDNLLRVPSSSRCIDVRLDVPGFRRVERLGVSGQADLQLQGALRVRLVLDSTGELPTTPYLFECDPVIDGQAAGAFEGSSYFTEGNREVVFLAAQPGTVRVRWKLSRQRESSTARGTISGHFLRDHEPTIEILDVPGEQRILVPLDADALTRLTRNPPF